MLKIPQIPISEKSARTIAEFCARNSISRAMFYKLKNAGKGPRLVRVGTKSLISDQAEKDWHREREADSPKAA
jgi:predicted DNA-binding transcriptional regulator AlpA